MESLASGLMHSIILNPKGSLIVGNVTSNIIIKTIKITTISVSSIIKFVTQNIDHGLHDIVNILNKTDLEFTADVINDVVHEHIDCELNEPIKKSLYGLNDILEKINGELISIKNAINYHKTKFFPGMRKFSWNGNPETLKNYSKILKHRYSILFELLKIYVIK